MQELTAWRLAKGEWDAVQQEHSRLAHAASLLEGAQAAIDALTEGDAAIDGTLPGVCARFTALADYDAALAPILATLEPARIQIQEAAHDLAQYLRRADLDPERLAQVAERSRPLHGAARRLRVAPPNCRRSTRA